MAEEFSRAVARVAAAQIAEASRFEAVQESAVDMLAELMVRYLSELGAASHSYAELAGRTDTNAGDVTRRPSVFPRSSCLRWRSWACRSARCDSFWRRMRRRPSRTCCPIKYPINAEPRHAPTFAEKGEEPPKHVPAYFPAFPDPHTYRATPVFPARRQDKATARKEQAKGRAAAEKALEQLNQRTAPGAPINYSAAEPSRWGHIPGEGGKGGGEGEVNPFLAPPVWEDANRAADMAPKPDAAHAALALGATAAAFRQAAGGGVEAVAAKKSKKGAGEGGGGLRGVDWPAGLHHTAAHLSVTAEGGVLTGDQAGAEASRDAAKDKTAARAKEILSQGAAAVLMEYEQEGAK